jgi:hypothetical protein
MNRQGEIESMDLIEEIERYLAAVAVFRAQDCEPTWRPETEWLYVAPERERSQARRTPSAH